jgi:P4 family phage/plasmid primase-like protien
LSGSFAGDPHGTSKISTLQEVAGSVAAGIATTGVTHPKALVLWGESAGNGKGQIADAMRGLLPADALSNVSPNELGDRNTRIQLANKLGNFSDELGTAHAIAGEKFKSVVTGDPIDGRDLYKSRVEFRCEAQHVYCANNLPSFTGGMDPGVQRRLLVMKLLRTIPDGERVAELGKLIAAQEPDLLLAWAVEGASRLLARGDFENPQWAQDALREWTTMADPVVAWCEARVEYAPGERLSSQKAHSSFTAWAREQGFRPGFLPAQNAFTQRARPILATRQIRYGHRGNGFRGFFDARLVKAEPFDINEAGRRVAAEMMAA